MSHKQIAGEFFSLTELTELTEPFCARFEPTERLRHTENTERYCYLWGEKCEKQNALTVRERALESSWVVLSLTESTELTELFNQRFEPTEGLRHTEITERYS